MDQIKKEHPEWVAEDGVCKPCAEYYRAQLRGESSEENIGPRGRRRRLIMGMIVLGFAFLFSWILKAAGAGGLFNLFLFPLFYLGMIGVIQARQKTCALLAVQGLRDMDTGEGKIQDPEVACELRRRGRDIFIQSALWAAGLAALTLIFPLIFPPLFFLINTRRI